LEIKFLKYVGKVDHAMEDPTKSIFWSSLFLGNGQGRVVNGPFANWTTPSEGRYLQRNIGLSRSSLINATSIQNVFRKRYNSEILTPTAARDIDNLERHHDSVHVWIGGHMGGTPSSPQDPVFFLHHCFIDYLWDYLNQYYAVNICLPMVWSNWQRDHLQHALGRFRGINLTKKLIL
jgi:tyrosinase